MKPAFRICLFFFVGYFGILYSLLCQVLSEDEKAIQDQAIQHIEKTPVDYNSLLDQALDFQVKADSTRRLANEKRERLENISGEEKRSKTEEEILELEKQAFEFQKLADEKYTLVREIEQKRLASQILTKKKEQSDKEQEGKETTPESGSVFDEAGMDVMNQIIDDFYLTEEFKDIFKKNELNALSDLVVINKEANKAMIDARKMQRELEKETVVSDAAQSKKENKRALKKIANLEKRILEKKFYSIDSYREVNDIRYRIFKEKINFLREGEATKGIVKQAQEYRKNAEISYQKALALRNEAEKVNQADRKYDKLAIANTYELLALENQKNALATFAGILPVKDQKRKIMESLSRVSDQQRKMDTISADLKREKAPGEKRTEITKISKTEPKEIQSEKAQFQVELKI